MTTPTERPLQLVAGDSWAWTRDLADHPRATWTVTYYFENRDQTFAIAGTGAAGEPHAFAKTAAETAGFKPGRYRVHARAVAGSEVHTLVSETGYADVLPNFGAAGTMDHRTWAERVLDSLRAAYEGRADTDQLSTSVNGRSISRMSKAELRTEIEAFEARVRREQNAEKVNAGKPAGNRILVRG